MPYDPSDRQPKRLINLFGSGDAQTGSRWTGPLSSLAVRMVLVLFRAKLWLSRVLMRVYIRVGATAYRHSAGQVALRREGGALVRESELLVAQRRLQRFISRVLLTKLAIALVALAATFSYTNPFTPPGFEGYVYEQPRILGAGGFKATQVGPANFGISFWRNKVINIDVRPDTHVEELAAVTRDDLTVSMRFSAVISIQAGHIAPVVDEFGGEEWYARVVKPRLRSLVQSAVQRRTSYEVQAQRADIEGDVRQGLEAYLRDTPFVLRDLAVTDMAYPDKIASAVQHKFEARQILEEKQTQLEIARRDVEIGIVQAKGQAEVQRLVSDSLTPMFLQHEAIQAQERGAQSPSRTTVYVPTGLNNVPLADGAASKSKP